VNVLDWTGNAYGKIVRIEFLKKLRDEERYVDLPALTAAIQRDVEQARAYFVADIAAKHGPATGITDRIS